MSPKDLVVFITALSAATISAKYIKTSFHVNEFSPNLNDDIRLTPDQEQQLRERGFYSTLKWPKNNGVVKVPYYIDPVTFPAGDPFIAKFKTAVDIYNQNTCIEWSVVPQSAPIHKVKIFKGEGCYSYVGMTSEGEQPLSLGDHCDDIGTMLHEMGHCMGLIHTQSRPDRDQYVKVWPENIEPGYERNFDKITSETYNTPYDYKSMMHYGSNYFSTNGSFTLTTLDPFAMFSIGQRPNTFRFSDSGLLNRGYGCITDFARKCLGVNCLNGGFVGKSCKCQCPENTSGANCGTVTGPYFADKPTCGGEVTTAGTIVPKGYPTSSTLDYCIFVIKAPACKVPAITFTKASFYWNICAGNLLSLQVSPSSYGYTWCDDSEVPFQKTIVSESQTASVFYYTRAMGFSDLGFKADIQFVKDPKCP